MGKQGVKITIVGAGSVRDLCVNPGLRNSHVTLMDIDQGRLDMIARLAEWLSNELDAGLSFSQTTDREQSLKGADFVINTAQVGGHGWTEVQRSLAEKHGYSATPVFEEGLLDEWFAEPRNARLAKHFCR